MLTAFTREVSPLISECQLTFMERQAIDYRKACEQHTRYKGALKDLGLDVVSLPCDSRFPDAVFVEDNAVIADEVAVICRLASPSRRDEVRGLAEVLSQCRIVQNLGPGATLEGGDVVFCDDVCYVGRSTRTNQQGIDQLAAILAPFGYAVRAVPVVGCLHLSTAVSHLGNKTALINPRWVDSTAFSGLEVIEVPCSEPWAANVLAYDGKVLLAAGHLATRALLEKRGYITQTVDISEFMKAEAGLTCMSLRFEADPQKGRACIVDRETVWTNSSAI